MILHNYSYKRHLLSPNTYALGTIKSTTLPSEEALLVGEHYGKAVSTVSVFQRLSMDGEVYFCQLYSRVKRRNSYTVKYGVEKYGKIFYFITHKNKHVAMMRKLIVLPPCEQFLPTRTIVPVTVDTNLEVVDIASIQQKVIFISTSDSTSYIVRFPCALNID